MRVVCVEPASAQSCTQTFSGRGVCVCVCEVVCVGLSSKADPVAQPRILTPTIYRKQAHLQSHTTSVREGAGRGPAEVPRPVRWPAKVLTRCNSGCEQPSLWCTVSRRKGCLTSVKQLLCVSTTQGTSQVPTRILPGRDLSWPLYRVWSLER